MISNAAPMVQPRGALDQPWYWLTAGLLLLGLMFQAEIVSAVTVWSDSTAYNHCTLIIPITAYLIYERRHSLHGLRPQPWPVIAFAAVPVAAAWLAAERLGIMEGRQLACLSFAQIMILAVLGWRFWRAVMGPLLYLYFLVPFGQFLVPKLQDITSIFVQRGLELLEIPAYVDGYVIEIPEGTFFIAEACAGLRFLIASVAFGCLYALLNYRTTPRRCAFVAASIVVPIVANGFRALGIVVLGHHLGSAEAAAADHVVYGWVFFSVVILLLTLAGLPFREDGGAQARSIPAPVPLTPSRSALVAVAAVLLAAVLSPTAAAALNRIAVEAAPPQPLALEGLCTTISVLPQGSALNQRVRCGPTSFDLQIAALPVRGTASPLLGLRARMTHAAAGDEALLSWVDDPAGGGRLWLVSQIPSPAHVSAVALWVDGRPTVPGLTMRTRLAWQSVFGGGAHPVVIAVTPVADWRAITAARLHDITTEMVAFLQQQRGITAQVQRMAGAS